MGAVRVAMAVEVLRVNRVHQQLLHSYRFPRPRCLLQGSAVEWKAQEATKRHSRYCRRCASFELLYYVNHCPPPSPSSK